MGTRRVRASCVWWLLLLGVAGYLAVGLSREARSKDDPKALKSWQLEGRVIDDQGRAVTGARVFTNELPYLSSAKQSSTMSDDLGGFVLKVAHRINGRAIRVSDLGGKRQGFIRLPYEAEEKNALKPLDLTLRPAREITANVVDASGAPVAGALVLVTSGYEQFETAETDAGGRAVLLLPADLPLQNVIAVKLGAGLDYWAFRAKDEPKGDPYKLAHDHDEPLRLVLNGVRDVTVRVVDEKDKPIAGARVYPWLLSKLNKGGQRDDLNLSGLSAFTRETDDQGVARFDSVPSDNTRTISFWARAKGYHSPDRHSFDPASHESEVLAKLLPLVKVTGRVVSAERKPVADIEVMAAGSGYGTDGFRESTRTNSDGVFEFQTYPDQYYQFVAVSREWASPAFNKIIRAGALVDDLELVVEPATRVFGRLTIGPNKAPAAKQYISLYQRETGNYYDLFESERLPNPKDSSTAINPLIAQSMTTDSEGRFEFFAGPGSYYMIGPENMEVPKFDINGHSPLEINLHLERVAKAPISGRVVLRDDPNQGVDGATVSGVSINFSGQGLIAISDEHGRFQTDRETEALLVHAATKDTRLAGIIEIGADDPEVTIQIGPTASASGQLSDEESAAPVANRQIDFGVKIVNNDGTFSQRFGASTTTDAEGNFKIGGLVPGQEYELNAVIGTDGEGRARSWRTIAKVTAPTTDAVSLGQLKLPAPEERVAKAFTDPRTLEERLQERLRDTRLSYQRVLLIIGDPQNLFVKQFYELEHDEHLSKEVYNYLFVPVSTVDAARQEEAEKLLAQVGIAWPKENEALLVVLDEAGVVVASKPFHEFTSDEELEHGKLAAYLREHAPELPDAETKLADALAEAKSDGKRILIQVSGARCGWCFVLSRFLDDNRKIIEKEFAYVKLDSRLKNGQSVIDRVRPNGQAGIPWMVVLNENGDPLITSDGPHGNIGYPGEPEGQVQFEKMLREDVKKLSDDEIKSLIDALAKANN